MKCSLCGKQMKECGNNAAPLSEQKCCDDCNVHTITPLRLFLMKESSVTAVMIDKPEVKFFNYTVYDRNLLLKLFNSEYEIYEENKEFIVYTPADVYSQKSMSQTNDRACHYSRPTKMLIVRRTV